MAEVKSYEEQMASKKSSGSSSSSGGTRASKTAYEIVAEQQAAAEAAKGKEVPYVIVHTPTGDVYQYQVAGGTVSSSNPLSIPTQSNPQEPGYGSAPSRITIVGDATPVAQKEQPRASLQYQGATIYFDTPAKAEKFARQKGMDYAPQSVSYGGSSLLLGHGERTLASLRGSGRDVDFVSYVQERKNVVGLPLSVMGTGVAGRNEFLYGELKSELAPGLPSIPQKSSGVVKSGFTPGGMISVDSSVKFRSASSYLSEGNDFQVAVDRTLFNVDTFLSKLGPEARSGDIIASGLALGAGAVGGAYYFVGHPIKAIKGIPEAMLRPVESIRAVQESENPLGEIGKAYGMGKAMGWTTSYGLPKVTVEKFGVDKVLSTGASVPVKGWVLGIETPKIAEWVGIKTGTPIAGRVSAESFVRGGEVVRAVRTREGKFVDTGKGVGEYEYFVGGGKGLAGRVRPGELDSVQGVAQPVSRAGFDVFNRVLTLSKAEEARVGAFKAIAGDVYREKGLRVKEFVVNIEGVKNPERVTQLVENYMERNEGVYFGSLVSKQLPDWGGIVLGDEVVTRGFQSIKQGDIDVMHPRMTVEEIKPRVEELARELQASGEDIGVSRGNILEFKSGEFKGQKFLEAKSGVNQESLGLGDSAPAGIAGFRFANLKEGRGPSVTQKFGRNVAITAGEQTLRKFAGALIVSPGKAAGETVSFSKAGLLGKQGNPRGLKDTAGAIQQSAGIAALKSVRLSPLEWVRGARIARNVDAFWKSYSKGQRKDIVVKLQDMIGKPEKVGLVAGDVGELGFSGGKVFGEVTGALVKRGGFEVGALRGVDAGVFSMGRVVSAGFISVSGFGSSVGSVGSSYSSAGVRSMSGSGMGSVSGFGSSVGSVGSSYSSAGVRSMSGKSSLSSMAGVSRSSMSKSFGGSPSGFSKEFNIRPPTILGWYDDGEKKVRKSKSKKRKSYRGKSKYVPSLVAAFYNVRGRRPGRLAVSAGVGIRPLPVSKFVAG